MAINNVYNQTPKRIYTNKPFVKGMNYTNADMAEYVCKSVANLDLESSNTATKLRSGSENQLVSENLVLKFYSKLVVFKNTISEYDYVNNRLPNVDISDIGLGIEVLTESSKTENDIYEYIINTSSQLHFNGSTMDTPDDYLTVSSNAKVFALALSDGTIPHTLYNNDFSFAFFGIIYNSDSDTIIYKGIIKLYFHVALQKIIIEVVKSSIVDPVEVNSYGSNLVANNPLIFKDYVYFNSGKDYYIDSGLSSVASDKGVMDISSVMIYDQPVIFDDDMNLLSGSTSNVIKGIDKTTDEVFYIRPYCTIPKCEPLLAVSIPVENGELFYNFESGAFEKSDLSESNYIYTTLDGEKDTWSRFISDVKEDPMTKSDGISIDIEEYDIPSDIVDGTISLELFKNKDMYTIISDEYVNTGYNLMFRMYKLAVDAATTDIKLSELKTKYNESEPLEVPINFKTVAHRQIYAVLDDNTWLSQFSETNAGLGGFLRNNIDELRQRFIETESYERESNIENFINGVAKIYINNNKLYCKIDIKPVLNEDGSIANLPLARIANSFGKRFDGQEGGSDSLDIVWGAMRGINGFDDIETIMEATSFHPSDLTYDTDNVYQMNYNGIVEENYYEVVADYKIILKDKINAIDYKFVKEIELNSNTEPLNIGIKASALNNSSIINNSILFKVHLLNKKFQTDEYYSYVESDRVQVASAFISLYKHDILKYDSVREDNNPLLATRIINHLGHYVLYGSYTGTNALYYSYFNDISYFPSMYVIEFDSPIVYVHNHQSNLVVFTEDNIHLIYNGNVPSTTSDDGSEIPFTVRLIQSNVRLGADNINTVRSIGKDVFFISSNSIGYLLKTNKYVSDASDTYLINVTNAIGDLLKTPYTYALNRYKCYYPDYTHTNLTEKFIMAPILKGSIIGINPDSYDSIYLSELTYGYEIVDGDTFYSLNEYGQRRQGYRLAYLDTPEINYNNSLNSERLALQAKEALTHMINSMVNPIIVYHHENKTDSYGRILCYIIDYNAELSFVANTELLRSGLAKIAFEDSYINDIGFIDGSLGNYINKAAEEAKYYNRGLYNNTNYVGFNSNEYASEGYNTNYSKLFVHANNSNIYIIQSVVLKNEAAMTIIYKYDIDSRTWITYDVPYPLFPNESAADNNPEGFKLYCNNTYKISQVVSSIFNFVKDRITDNTQIAFNKYPLVIVNDEGKLISTLRWMNVYFDTGNQSLALMNDKLFREFKLSLGTTSDKELDIDYKINFYVDERPVISNNHYQGSCETYEGGYKKITFFTPARGRIPRFEFIADCRSDLNILQYAIVYLQLNAK